MKKSTEAADPRQIIAIYPGRFQMPHRAHGYINHILKQEFDDVWIAMTNCFDDSNSDSPLDFETRKKLLSYLYISPSRVMQVKNPYRAIEIICRYRPQDVIVFVVGEKDKDRFEFKPKKNGQDGYLQPYEENKNDLMGQDQHAYVKFVSTRTYFVNACRMTSATEARNFYKSLNKQNRRQFAVSMYEEDISDFLDDKFGLITDDALQTV